MKIKFSITKEFDIEQIIKDEEQKKWFWKNSFPSISEETRPEELTDAQKIALIKLLIYEGWLGGEDDLSNLPDSNFALINEPVETTNEQPINFDFDNLSKTKKDLFLTCYYAILCIDDSKVKPLKIDIEEEAAVTIRQLIEIRKGSIDFGVKINKIDVIDENIEW